MKHKSINSLDKKILNLIKLMFLKANKYLKKTIQIVIDIEVSKNNRTSITQTKVYLP